VANGSITRTIGATDTGSGKLSSTGSTGFLTDTSDLTIALLNGGAPIAWGGGVFNAGTVVFNGAASTHNITFNADLQMDNSSRGIVLNAGTVTWNGALTGGAGGTLTLNASGNAPGGTLIMPHNNSSYTGAFNVDVVGSQVIQVLATDALGTGTLGLNDGGAGKTTQVQLIGGAGGISLDNSLIFTQQRDNGVPFLENISGNNTVTGTIQLGFGGAASIIRTDSGLLTLTGTIQQASTAGISPRNLILSGEGVAAGSVGGPAGAAQSSFAVSKTGTGTWVFKGTNGYTGSTTVTSGTLTADASSNTAFGIGTVTVNGGTLNLNGANAIAGAGTGALIVSSGWVNATVANATASVATVILNGGTTVLRDPQAFGGNTIVVGANIQNVNPVLDLQTDGGDKTYDISMSSFDGLTVTLSRATPGATVTHNLGRLIPGVFTTFTFVSGTNVTGAAPIVSVAGINITSGSALTGASVLNPIGAVLSVGTVSTSNSGFSRTLELSGSSTGNAVTSTIFEGNNTLGITKSGPGSWVLSGSDNFYSGVTTVKAGTLEITPGAQVPIFSNTIGADVQGGALLLDYSGSSIATQVRNSIHAGQIVDTVATTGVGVAYFDDGLSAVTVRPDVFGDATGDNKVNALDFNTLATNFGAGQFWQQGDFNYDGVVDSSDFVLLSQNFGRTLPAPASLAAPVLGSVVPEPISLALLAVPLLSFRRRHRSIA
jgi:autotransporter-associated beta strand protein